MFTLANRPDQLDKETRQMATLLAKFRINFTDVIAIPDVTKKANEVRIMGGRIGATATAATAATTPIEQGKVESTC